MTPLGYLFITVITFQVIFAQPPPNIPEQCRGPPPDVKNPHECCKIPPMFSDEDLEACGIPKLDEESEGPKFKGPPDCTKQKCILEKYELLKGEEIDYDAVSAFLDKWAEKNPDFKPTVATAKERCLGELPGPPRICAADKMMFCIGSTMFVECPTWEDNENCTNLKKHIETCRAAVPKPL